MTNKLIAAGVVIAVLVGAGSFYGGMAYSRRAGGGRGAAFANVSPEERAARMQQFGGGTGVAGGQGGARTRAAGGGVVAGSVIAMDDKTVTLKLRDGGSRIVFLGESTSVGKTVAGTRGDIQVGEEVTVVGTSNDDGSMTAQSVQIR